MLSLAAALMLTLTPSCGQVDPMTNSAVWFERGRMHVSSYRDEGELLAWSSNDVPFYIRALAYDGVGPAIRKGCA